MGLFPVWCHRLICIVLSLCKHACKEVCDVNPGIDPYPLLARSCNRWWPDFVTFTACKKSRFGLKRCKKVQCLLNRCKDLFERKKYFGVRYTLSILCTLYIFSWLLLYPTYTVVPFKHRYTSAMWKWAFQKSTIWRRTDQCLSKHLLPMIL